MSGPKTCSYQLRQIRAQEEAQRREEERRRREERLRQLKIVHGRCSHLNDRYRTLQQTRQRLAQQFPQENLPVLEEAPVRPEANDLESLRTYAGRLEELVAQAAAALQAAQKQAEANSELKRALSSAVSLLDAKTRSAGQLIEAYLDAKVERQNTAQRQERIRAVERVLGRLPKGKETNASMRIEQLSGEVLAEPSTTRANALLDELRLEVQRVEEIAKKKEIDGDAARSLLTRLEVAEDRDSAPIRQKLELVVAGVIPLGEQLRRDADQIIARATQLKVTAIVSETLTDLGYSVHGIDNTTFVSGGVAYFKRAEWSNYCVRLTSRPNEGRMNFNVVRLDAEQEGAAASDTEIENAWCDAYGQMTKSLRSRGLDMTLVRNLAPGSVAIPRIQMGEVPQSLRDEAKVSTRKGDAKVLQKTRTKPGGRH